MNIIGGAYKGRKLKSPPEGIVRPTLAKIREAFFDIAGQDIQNAAFLDMYAGSGAIGIEALSRGARSACFVERSRAAATLLSKNLAFIDSTLYEVMIMDVTRAMAQLEKKHQSFDILYFDPPYGDADAYTGVLNNLLRSSIMEKPWIAGIEHDKAVNGILQEAMQDMTLKTYRYGDTFLSIVRGH